MSRRYFLSSCGLRSSSTGSNENRMRSCAVAIAPRRMTMILTIILLSSCSYAPSWMGGREDDKPKLEGERKSALTAETLLKADESLKKSAPVLPNVVANNSWEQSSGVFTAATGNLSGGGFDKKDSAKAGDGNDFSHSLVPSPVVAGGLVFVMDAAGIISAHDAADIENIRWKSEAVADEDENEVMGGGLAVSVGVLYATTGQGQVAAINTLDGKTIWKKNLAVPLRSAPRAAGDKVIVTAIDSRTYALSAKNGDMLWDHRGIDETASVMNSVSPTLFNGGVLVPYSSGELFALSLADGNALWGDSLLQNKYNRASGVFTSIGADPVIDEQVAFVTSSSGVTVAINIPTGKRIWQQQLASINTPWLAGDEIFILTSDNVLVDVVKYSGKIRWVIALASYEDEDTKRRAISWRGPVLVGGKLVLTNSDGQLVFVSAASGKILETKSIPDNIYSAPVIAGGKLYLVGRDATLYSFQ